MCSILCFICKFRHWNFCFEFCLEFENISHIEFYKFLFRVLNIYVTSYFTSHIDKIRILQGSNFWCSIDHWLLVIIIIVIIVIIIIIIVIIIIIIIIIIIVIIIIIIVVIIITITSQVLILSFRVLHYIHFTRFQLSFKIYSENTFLVAALWSVRLPLRHKHPVTSRWGGH